jgi:nicotinate dehydrogenase subunit A
MTKPIHRLRINGREHQVAAEDQTPLLDVLRNILGLAGTRFGCGSGECGACHVLLDGVSTAACDTPVATVRGRAIVTVEGLAADGRPNALQQAFLDEQAGQCGYCLSGILVSATELLARVPHPSEAQVRAALDRHLCRCGAHDRIVRAVLRAAAARGTA